MWVRLAAPPGTFYCPGSLAKRYLEVRPQAAHPNLLVHVDGSTLTHSQFTRIFKWAVAQMGEDPACFTSHSIRIGEATTAASWACRRPPFRGWEGGNRIAFSPMFALNCYNASFFLFSSAGWPWWIESCWCGHSFIRRAVEIFWESGIESL